MQLFPMRFLRASRSASHNLLFGQSWVKNCAFGSPDSYAQAPYSSEAQLVDRHLHLDTADLDAMASIQLSWFRDPELPSFGHAALRGCLEILILISRHPSPDVRLRAPCFSE